MKKLFVFLFCITAINSFSQTVPCRNWSYKTDRNGNEIKDHCKEAWQENSLGQKHGKYIEYHDNGNPHLSMTFINGIKNGPLKEFDFDGTTVILTGAYSKGLKDGLWKLKNESGTYAQGKRTGIWTYSSSSHDRLTFNHSTKTFSLKWHSNTLNGNIQDGILNGQVLFKLNVEKVGTKGLYSNEVIYSLIPTINGHRQATLFDGAYSLDENSHVSRDIKVKEEQIETLNGESEIRYPISVDQATVNSIINHLKTLGKLPDLNLIIQLTNGQIDLSFDIKVYDNNGGLLNSFKLTDL